MKTVILLFVAFLLVTAAQAQGAGAAPAVKVNAARQIVSLDAPGKHQVTLVRIVDNDGFTVRTIATAPGSILRCSISELPPGRYLLRTNDPAIAEASFTKDKEQP